MSLGLAVSIIKVHDDEHEIRCSFSVGPGSGGVVIPEATGRQGLVSLNKGTGEVTFIRECPDDIGRALSGRAIFTIARHWRESASVPDFTSWEG